MNNKIIILLLVSSFLCLSCKKREATATTKTPTKTKALLPKGTTADVLIDKSDYELSLQLNGKTIKTYSVVFGKNPVDDKQKEGDSRTPEGEFGIRDKYPHKKWTKFIWIDYPNEASWKKFNDLKQRGIIKEGETIGGEIGIHGVPEGADYLIDDQSNWTLGCISMKNKDINEIYPYITKKSKITIRK